MSILSIFLRPIPIIFLPFSFTYLQKSMSHIPTLFQYLSFRHLYYTFLCYNLLFPLLSIISYFYKLFTLYQSFCITTSILRLDAGCTDCLSFKNSPGTVLIISYLLFHDQGSPLPVIYFSRPLRRHVYNWLPASGIHVSKL